jgi:hypothetical protein
MNSITINVSLFEFIIFIMCTVVAPIVNVFGITYISYNYGAVNAFWYFVLSSMIWTYCCIVLVNTKLEQTEEQI